MTSNLQTSARAYAPQGTWGAFNLARILVCLNAFDAVATVMLLHLGAVEANPVAAVLLHLGPWGFALFKVWMVGALITLLGILEAQGPLAFLVGVYAGAATLHLYMFGVWLFS